jgi:DNA-binding transcriptional ArsR family regulator
VEEATGLAPWDAAFAFAHPVRARIALLLSARGEPLSPSGLARELGEQLGTVAYHVTILLGLGALEEAGTRQVRGALEHFYVLADDDRLRAVIDALRPFADRVSGDGRAP